MHVKEPQVVQIIPECLATACLIIRSVSRHVEPQIILIIKNVLETVQFCNLRRFYGGARHAHAHTAFWHGEKAGKYKKYLKNCQEQFSDRYIRERENKKKIPHLSTKEHDSSGTVSFEQAFLLTTVFIFSHLVSWPAVLREPVRAHTTQGACLDLSLYTATPQHNSLAASQRAGLASSRRSSRRHRGQRRTRRTHGSADCVFRPTRPTKAVVSRNETRPAARSRQGKKSRSKERKKKKQRKKVNGARNRRRKRTRHKCRPRCLRCFLPLPLADFAAAALPDTTVAGAFNS